MEEKPHILILGMSTKRGRHTFNFDKYVVRLNYQFNTEGIIIELFPPNRKKQIDYNRLVSPYGGEEFNPKKIKARNMEKRRKKDKENARKTKKQNKENESKSEKLIKSSKDTKKTDIIKKCVIQEVFNFSEVPDAIEKFFPYEGPKSTNQNTIARKPKNQSVRDVRSKASFNRPPLSQPLGMKMTRHSDFDFFMRSRRSLNHCHSGMEICPEKSECSIDAQNSVSILQKKLGRLERENETLQKKLGCAYQPFL